MILWYDLITPYFLR